MITIPTQPVPSQRLAVTLNNQSCQINVRQNSLGMFCDLYVNDTPIIGGVICQNTNLIVRDAYLGFSGDLAFFDTQGDEDPVYTDLGTRFILCYIEPADLLAQQMA